MSNQEQKPDWTTAPEGANLFWANPCTKYPWFKREKGILYNFESQLNFWVDMEDVKHCFNPDEFIERPTINQQLTVPVVNQEFTTEEVACSKMETTTWNGQGLPPVGICEALWNSPDEYYKVNIIAHDNGEAVFRWLEGPRKGCLSARENIVNGGPIMGYHYKFRPIQPIKTDRDLWIEAACEAMEKQTCLIVSDFQLGIIYDAGLAKLPEQPR